MSKQQDIILVHQHHQADKAGFHIDWRVVIGNKAYSWATKKPVPPSGGKLILWEQPIHDKGYALSKKVVIPKGQYGAGTTELKYAQRGKAKYERNQYFELNLNNGDRFYIKKMPSYGDKAWLLVNLTGMQKKAGASFPDDGKGTIEEDIYPQPKPNPSPDELPSSEQQTIKDSTKEHQEAELLKNKFLLQIKKKNDPQAKPLVKKALAPSPAPKPSKKQIVPEEPLMGDSYPEQKHQSRVIDKLKKDHPRLLAYHGLGSGKTLTALKAVKEHQRNAKSRALYIAPASLTKNVEKEMKKHKIQLDKKRFDIMSYDKAVKGREKLMDAGYDMIIADEAHKLREEDTLRFQELKPLLDRSKKLLMLSGSPIYNKPENLATLVNTLAKKRILPEDPKEFENRFINNKKIDPNIFQRLFLRVKPGTKRELKNQKMLQRALSEYVDYYEPDEKAKAFYPRVKETEVKVPLSSDQQKYYNFFEENIPAPLKWKIRMGLPPEKRESTQLNAFLSGLRQVSNSHGPFKRDSEDLEASPKIETAVSNLMKKQMSDKNFRGLVYSNYLPAGLHPYSKMLKTLGVKHEMITGELTSKEKQGIVKDYNDGKFKVLLISSSGGEGLDLKGTKLIQVLDPHFNKEKINQVIGRGVRYKSHMHLPTEEQEVAVEHYLSTIKQTPLDKLFKIQPKSVDEYLYDRMKDKDQITSQVKQLLNKGN
jgi:superfamily II DNA or RNA helicase